MNYPGIISTNHQSSKTTASGKSKLRWTAFEHRFSRQKGVHVILAAYEPNGLGGLNFVRGIVPLYDLRDANLDGSISIGEWWGGYDPYEVYKLIKEAGRASFVAECATQLKDYGLYNKTIQGFLETTHKACAKAATTILVENVLSPGIAFGLAQTALTRLRYGSDVVQFIIQTGFETAIIEAICAARN